MNHTCVKIDLEKLGVRLSRDLGRQVGRGEVQAWLSGRGFTPADNEWWRCADAEMSQLQSDEIKHVRVFTEAGDATFVENSTKQ